MLPAEPEQLSCSPGDSTAAQAGIAPGKSFSSHFLVQSSCSQCSINGFDKKPQKAGGMCARIMTDVRRMRDGGITSPLVSPAMAWIQVWTWVMKLLPHTQVGPFRLGLLGIQDQENHTSANHIASVPPQPGQWHVLYQSCSTGSPQQPRGI